MTTVGRTPFSTSMRDDVEGVVAAADHRDMRSQVDARLAHERRAEMHAARGRQAARILDLVEPLLAAEPRSGGEHHGEAGQRLRRPLVGKPDIEREPAVGHAREASRPGTEPGLDRRLPDMPHEFLRVLASGQARSSEQPIVAIGVAPGQAAEHRPPAR